MKNAHLMLVLARRLREYGEQAGETEFSFAERGEKLANVLHYYGHNKGSPLEPNWEAAGLWTRIASEAVERTFGSGQ